MERIIITFDKEGKFRGASVTGFNDQPLPIDAEALGKLAPEINAAVINRTIIMKAEHKDAIAAKDAEMAAAMAEKQAEIDSRVATIAAKDAEIATLQPGYVAPEPPSIEQRVADAIAAVIESLPEEEKAAYADVAISFAPKVEPVEPDEEDYKEVQPPLEAVNAVPAEKAEP